MSNGDALIFKTASTVYLFNQKTGEKICKTREFKKNLKIAYNSAKHRIMGFDHLHNSMLVNIPGFKKSSFDIN